MHDRVKIGSSGLDIKLVISAGYDKNVSGIINASVLIVHIILLLLYKTDQK